MNGRAGREGETGPRRRPGAIAEPVRLVLFRPRAGWVAGLLGAGLVMIGGLLAVAVTLAVLAAVTVALWWMGEAQVPVVVLAYAFAILAGCGFAAGRANRAYGRRSRLPEGPSQVSWQPGSGRVPTGLTWETADPGDADYAGAGGAGPDDQEAAS
jgi:hypothetical protein